MLVLDRIISITFGTIAPLSKHYHRPACFFLHWTSVLGFTRFYFRRVLYEKRTCLFLHQTVTFLWVSAVFCAKTLRASLFIRQVSLVSNRVLCEDPPSFSLHQTNFFGFQPCSVRRHPPMQIWGSSWSLSPTSPLRSSPC